MLPVITENSRTIVETTLRDDPEGWKRQMVHRLKEENPEINTILLELAQSSSDPKAVIQAGYLVYNVLEQAFNNEQ